MDTEISPQSISWALSKPFESYHRENSYDYNIEIVELEIPVDHIHMVVRSEPKICPSEIMQIIKSISAREFFKLHPDIKKRYFWGGKLWTQSFFVETIGNANEETFRKYVQNQLEVMDKAESKTGQLNLFQNSVACGRVVYESYSYILFH